MSSRTHRHNRACYASVLLVLEGTSERDPGYKTLSFAYALVPRYSLPTMATMDLEYDENRGNPPVKECLVSLARAEDLYQATELAWPWSDPADSDAVLPIVFFETLFQNHPCPTRLSCRQSRFFLHACTYTSMWSRCCSSWWLRTGWRRTAAAVAYTFSRSHRAVRPR